MDDLNIRAWLLNTADREPPEPHSDHDQIQPQYSLQPAEAKHPARRPHRKRRRASSDRHLSPSPRQSRHRKRSALSARSSSSALEEREQRGTAPTSSHSRSISSSRHRDSSPQEAAPAETFEKRARHKTKSDRYDHKPKRKKDTFALKKRSHETKSKRQKSRRNKDGTATAGIVQCFQLKNGPKNNRLTLKPDVCAGIFRHGRSSLPVAPAGRGLPDLAFNEMRFLRNPKEHQNELSQDELPTYQAKKSRKQLQEEEVSSFFANRPPRAKIPEHRQSPQARHKNADDGCRLRAVHARPQRPPIELPDNLFLGFGSRGPSHDRRAASRNGNSDYTWSESLSQHSPARDQQRTTQAHVEGEPRLSGPRQTSHVSNTPATRAQIGGQNSHTTGELAEQHVRRDGRPNLTKVEAQQAMNRRRQTAAVVSSQSLPKVGSIGRSASTPNPRVHDQKGTSFHTSDILNLAAPLSAANLAPPSIDRPHEQENLQPVSSGPDSETLRQALDNVAKLHRLTTPDLDEQRRWQRSADGHRVHALSRNAIWPANEMDLDLRNTIKAEEPRWTFPQRGFSRASDANRFHQEPSLGHVPARRTSSRQTYMCHSPPIFQRPEHVDDNDEMLDDLPDIPPHPLPEKYAHCNSRWTEDLVRQLISDQDGPNSVVVQEQNEDESERFMVDQSWADVPASLDFEDERGTMVRGQHVRQSMGQEVDEAVDHGLAGFWRPNKLY